MEEGNPLAALATTGSVGSRFVSQAEIDSAKERRDADWKAAYARLGQEPPPKPVEDETYDGRSLYEGEESALQPKCSLVTNCQTAKQEEWEEKAKLSNQFRALEEDEIHFLDGIMDEKIIKEKKRKDEENEELKNFREAVAQKAAQQSAAPAPTPSTTKPPATKPAASSTAPAKNQPKKNQKSLLKGAIVRKPTGAKPGFAASPTTSAAPKPTVQPDLPTKTGKDSSKPAPKSPTKDNTTLGKKRSEASLSETVDENTENSQSTKRQKV
ncbi:hypothetical protein FRC12_010429 [Ceratobasidium sp. 428]|nr:hypothetical protein FRC12_010429 [Ceratobasidium sp. 428]